MYPGSAVNRILELAGGQTRPYQRVNPQGRVVQVSGYKSRAKILPAPLPHPVPMVRQPPALKPGMAAWSAIDQGDTIQIGQYQYQVLQAHMTANQITAAQKQAQLNWAQGGRNAKATKVTTAASTGGPAGSVATATTKPGVPAPSTGIAGTALGGKPIPSTTATDTSFLKEIGTGRLYVVALPLSTPVRVIKA